MGTVIGIVIVVIVILFFVLIVVGMAAKSITKSLLKAQGLDRCLACKSRLKFADGAYADKCHKCGADQRPLRAARAEATADKHAAKQAKKAQQ